MSLKLWRRIPIKINSQLIVIVSRFTHHAKVINIAFIINRYEACKVIIKNDSFSAFRDEFYARKQLRFFR